MPAAASNISFFMSCLLASPMGARVLVVSVVSCLTADPPSESNVLLLLLVQLLDVARVPRGELELLLGGDPGLELAAALELGVQLGAEEQRQVGDPQPQQRHDHAGH